MADMVTETFSDPSEESYRSDYMVELRDNWRHVTVAHTRDVVLILLLGAIFELMARSAITRVSIGPFEIGDIPVVLKVLPLLIAYLFYDVAILDTWHALMESAHGHLMRLTHSRVRSADFDWLLVPRVHPLTHTLTPTNSRLPKFTNIVLGLAFVAGVVGFEIRATYIEFRTFGARDPLVWICAVLSALLIVSAFAIFAEGAGEPKGT